MPQAAFDEEPNAAAHASSPSLSLSLSSSSAAAVAALARPTAAALNSTACTPRHTIHTIHAYTQLYSSTEPLTLRRQQLDASCVVARQQHRHHIPAIDGWGRAHRAAVDQQCGRIAVSKPQHRGRGGGGQLWRCARRYSCGREREDRDGNGESQHRPINSTSTTSRLP